MNNVLEIDSVILEFAERRILQDIYLKCETGLITGLLGRNGSGKTCLMNIMYGKLVPGNRSVRINRHALPGNSRALKSMMYLPQFGFIPQSLKLKRIFEDFKHDFSEFVNEFPEFSKYYNSRVGELSGGEQRIIEIYLIVVSRTKFCLLDEPFSQVMPVHIDTIKRLIIKEKNNKGILITDHLYRHIIDVCDHIYVLNNGKTYLTKSIQDLEYLGYLNIH